MTITTSPGETNNTLAITQAATTMLVVETQLLIMLLVAIKVAKAEVMGDTTIKVAVNTTITMKVVTTRKALKVVENGAITIRERQGLEVAITIKIAETLTVIMLVVEVTIRAQVISITVRTIQMEAMSEISSKTLTIT